MSNEPPAQPPPSGPPPGWELPSPGAVSPAPGAAPPAPRSSSPVSAPPAYPPTAYPATQPSGKTEPFAIVSLAVALGGILICLFPVTGILAVVFGHVALGRIKRTGMKGRGMALAGVIVGYAEIVLGVILIAGFIVLGAVSVNSTNDARRDADRLGRDIQDVAVSEDIPTRSAEAVRRAVLESDLDEADVTLATTGRRAVDATTRRLDAELWQLEVSTSLFGSACLIVPSTPSAPVIVRDTC
ncbi:MAG TPA: DUF4190 domain-containing protein [Acidimicrobiia bacterium]|nr:DUF4190 domain-containing protein [Acidimicrobiia bacterium]